MAGKYRGRTWLRGKLPAALWRLVPPGRDDCGEHEWHLAEEGTWHCYHCEVGVTHENPFTIEEQVWLERERLIGELRRVQMVSIGGASLATIVDIELAVARELEGLAAHERRILADAEPRGGYVRH